MILMKAKTEKSQKKPAAHKLTTKVHMPATATGLTSQTGLIPVVKFLQRIVVFEKTLNQIHLVIKVTQCRFHRLAINSWRRAFRYLIQIRPHRYASCTPSSSKYRTAAKQPISFHSKQP
jgi:hypothetical protein